MTTKAWLSALGSLVLCAAGCHDDDIGDPTGATCDTSSALTYMNFGANFMKSYCTPCHSETPSNGKRHGAPKGVDFDTQMQIKQQASDVDRSAGKGPNANNTFMPAANAPHALTGFAMPTDSERAQLASWLACGAP